MSFRSCHVVRRSVGCLPPKSSSQETVSVAVGEEGRHRFRVRLPRTASCVWVVVGRGRPGSLLPFCWSPLLGAQVDSTGETTAVCTGPLPDVSVCAVAFSPETGGLSPGTHPDEGLALRGQL